MNLRDFCQPWIPTARTIWIADVHRGDGQRHVVRADEKLTAFLELERAVCIHLLTDKEIAGRFGPPCV